MGKKFNKEAAVNTVKKVGAIASSTGSVALICGVARAILPPGVNVIVSGAITLGGTILGGFIGDQLTDYVDKQIDTMIEEGKEMRSLSLRQYLSPYARQAASYRYR